MTATTTTGASPPARHPAADRPRDRERTADGTHETARAGDVYHWPAGHTAHADEDVVFIEVGPVGPMRQFSDHAKSVLA